MYTIWGPQTNLVVTRREVSFMAPSQKKSLRGHLRLSNALSFGTFYGVSQKLELSQNGRRHGKSPFFGSGAYVAREDGF